MKQPPVFDSIPHAVFKQIRRCVINTSLPNRSMKAALQNLNDIKADYVEMVGEIRRLKRELEKADITN